MLLRKAVKCPKAPDHFAAINRYDPAVRKGGRQHSLGLAVRRIREHGKQNRLVGDVKVGVSIGSVTTEGPTTTKEALLKRADTAMYEAKRNGTGYVQSRN